MQTRRCKQVGVMLKTELGRIIQTRLNDPLIGFVTVTEVEVAKDLKHAKVYISVLGEETDERNAVRGLERARTFIQNELKQVVRLRFLPILSFHLDTSWKTGARIDKLLHEIARENGADSHENGNG